MRNCHIIVSLVFSSLRFVSHVSDMPDGFQELLFSQAAALAGATDFERNHPAPSTSQANPSSAVCELRANSFSIAPTQRAEWRRLSPDHLAGNFVLVNFKHSRQITFSCHLVCATPKNNCQCSCGKLACSMRRPHVHSSQCLPHRHGPGWCACAP